MAKIGLMGAGTWGMALARMLSNTGHSVVSWSALPEEIDEISVKREQKNLPGVRIPDEIVFTKNIEEACTDKDIILFAIPSNFVRSVAKTAQPWIPDGQIIVDVGKGIEASTFMTLSEVIEDELKTDGKHDNVRMVALSGPTHAEEVARDIPTTIVSASPDTEAAEYVQSVFMNPLMRVYTNTDRKGVELCGAMKNIIALASGMLTGLGYGDNTRAALITRGMLEISRLGRAIGCLEQTFHGLAGIGDLIVTATSIHSRNNKAGMLIGKGKTPEQAVEEVGMVVEGINALPAAMRLSSSYEIEMPIVFAVNDIINHGADPRQKLNDLMMRDPKSELA